MAINQHRITVEQFEDFVDQSENADKLFEFIGGEIVEVPSNAYSSKIAMRIGGFIFMYLHTNDIGHLTGEHGGYKVNDDRYAPDVGFVLYTSQDELDKQGYNSVSPDLAVEVMLSDSNRENAQLTIKIGNYLAVQTTVWIVRPDTKTIEVYQAGKPVETYHNGQFVSGGDIVPNFELKLDDIFKPS